MIQSALLQSGLSPIALRILTQALRFGLSFYVIGFLGLHAAGIYGLAIGAAGIAPALIGWGLNYHLSREIVGHTPADAAPLIRDRMAISLGSLAALSLPAALAIGWAAPAGDWWLCALILALIWFETLALDIFVALIALEKAFLANVLVLVRSALWVPLVIALALVDPRFRTLEALFATWIGFHLLAMAIFAACLRGWHIRAGLGQPIRLDWAKQWVRTRWFIYLSDLAYVGLVYFDRYIVVLVLGLAATAVYAFYWALANALQTIILTALVQIAGPRLIRAARQGGAAAWHAEMRQQMAKTAGLALILAALNFGATEAIIFLAPEGKVPVDRGLFLLLLLAAVIRCCSDMLNAGLMSLKQDKSYAAVNLLGLAVTVVVGPIAMLLWGLAGAGVALVLTATTLLAFRLILIRRGLPNA